MVERNIPVTVGERLALPDSRRLPRQAALAGKHPLRTLFRRTDLRLDEIEVMVDGVGSITTRVRPRDGSFVHIPNDQLVQNVVREDVS